MFSLQKTTSTLAILAGLAACAHAAPAYKITNINTYFNDPGEAMTGGVGTSRGEDDELYTVWTSFGFTTGADFAWEVTEVALAVSDDQGPDLPSSLSASIVELDSQGRPLGQTMGLLDLTFNHGSYLFLSSSSTLLLAPSTSYGLVFKPTGGYLMMPWLYVGEGGPATSYSSLEGWTMDNVLMRSGDWMSGGLGTQWEAGEHRGVFAVNATQVAVSAVPEPSTYALLFGGAALVTVIVRRRLRAGAAV